MKTLMQICLCIAAGSLAFGARLAAQEKLADEKPLELPPFVVNGYALPDETWRYGAIEGFEVLSEASASRTREVVAALWRGRQMALPPEMRTHFDAPMVVVIFDHFSFDSAPQGAGHEKHPGEMNRHWTNVIKRTTIDRESFAINLRGSEFEYSPGFRFDIITLFRRRAPRVPLWLNESLFGGYGLYREGIGLDGAGQVKQVKPLSWHSEVQLKKILKFKFKKRPPAKSRHLRRSDFGDGIQPLQSVFEGAPPRDPLGAAKWRNTAALFARWAIYAKQKTAADFWSFSQLACRQPVTEELFRRCFGMSYEEVEAELSWYLIDALTEYESAPAKLTPMPRLSMSPAKKSEVARMLGEWERIEAESLAGKSPEIANKYRVHALEKLQQSYKNGVRDPRLLATLGLLLESMGDSAGACDYLEQAVAGNVAGPRAYLELARLRLAREGKPDDTNAKGCDTSRVVGLLLKAEAKGPPLREVYTMLAATNGDGVSPEENRKAALRRGLAFFPLDADLCQRIERALNEGRRQP